MSEIPTDDQLLNEAREEIAAAIGRYADAWDSTEGGVITAFVCCAEVILANGERMRLELSGNGAGDSEAPTSMIYGLLFGYLHDR